MTEHSRDTSRLASSRARVLAVLERTSASVAESTGRMRESEVGAWCARAVRAVRAWLAPITPLGWIVAGIGIVTLVTGLALGWRELVIVGVITSSALLIASVFVLGQARYRVDVDLEFTRVVVGERALGQIEIESMSARQLMPTSIEVPVGSALAIFDLPRMAYGDVHEDIFVIPTDRRGVLSVGPVRSVKGDALGLVRRQVKWTSPVDLFVHPKTLLLADATAGIVRDLEGVTTRELSSSDIAFHALRDYVPGDDRRFIHWKSTARTGSLMVRQFEQTRRSKIVLAISTHEGDYGDGDDFETGVSIIGTLGLQAIRDEMQLNVITSGQRVTARTGRSLLDGLSRIEYEPRAKGLSQLASEIGRTYADCTLVVLAAGAGTTVGDVQRARLLIPASSRVIAYLVQPDADSGVKELSDLTIVTIRSLSELPTFVRKLGES